MTIQDATKIIYMLHAAYHTDRKATENELLDRIDLFSVIFADYDAALVGRVVKGLIKQSRFMPTLEEIKTACDTQRALDAKIAQAGNIHDITVTPEDEARLEALIESIIESEIEEENHVK